jgi:hypothetical protein
MLERILGTVQAEHFRALATIGHPTNRCLVESSEFWKMLVPRALSAT